MTTRAAVRRSLLNALLDLERVDDAALDEAFKHAQRAAFCILDLRGSSDPIRLSAPEVEPPDLTARPHRPPGKPSGTQQAASFFATSQGTGTHLPYGERNEASGVVPTGTEGSAAGAALAAPNVRDVQGGR